MNIIYQTLTTIDFGPSDKFRNIKRPDKKKEWYLGIDGGSIAYGLCLYTFDYSEIHFFVFSRDNLETADTFREALYSWLANYLFGVKIQVATYERTPEGYKPPTTHAEKVMRETERAVKNFLYDGNYILISSKDYIFDIFPNTWKAFSVPKTEENLGKTNKRLNAIGILESCGLDAETLINRFERVPYKNDYDCFEALGVGRYGSHFITQDDGTVKIYKNFSKIGTSIIAAKRIDIDEELNDQLQFVGSFGGNKIPRLCTLNENHSVAENLLGLHDKEFNNILLVPADHPDAMYLDLAMNFDIEDTRGYIILGIKSSKTEVGEELIRNNGFTPFYI